MSVTIKINTMTKSLKDLQQKLKDVPKDFHQEFVKNTPIKTGNAKKKTKLRGNTVTADYGYAEVLDKGRHMTKRGLRGSEQAPKGMTKPTVDWLKKHLKKILRK